MNTKQEIKMKKTVDIGIIGALSEEVNTLIAALKRHKCEKVGGVDFHTGVLEGKKVVIARCGVGKVFAALCAEAMIIRYSPKLIVNTGVGGALEKGISVGDILVASRLVQHDMDTSPLGDPKGLISGINVVYFDTDERARGIVRSAAEKYSIKCHEGTVASGDVFVSTDELKAKIREEFGAAVCEMEGVAIAHVAYVNATPCCVIRAISDSADEGSSIDYQTFLPLAAKNSSLITMQLCREF